MAKATVGNNQRNEHFTMRDSKEFSSCREAEAYLDSVSYWADPVLIADTDEADKFQRANRTTGSSVPVGEFRKQEIR